MPGPEPALAVTALEDVRSTDPVERLMEESWSARKQPLPRRELIAESLGAALFLVLAVGIGGARLLHLLEGAQAWRVALLLGLCAVSSRTIRFPIGSGYAAPMYLILVPMLVLLPPNVVPLLVAGAMFLGGLGRLACGKTRIDRLPVWIADSWSSAGPALVLWLGQGHHDVQRIPLYAGAFLAGGFVDLVVSTLREHLGCGGSWCVEVHVRVWATVWLVDASVASLGLLAAEAARAHPLRLLMLLPFCGMLFALDRERTARISQAQFRLRLVGRERTRLQAAIQRLGEAFAAKLDLVALSRVLLGGSIDALDAEGGRFVVRAAHGSVLEDAAPAGLEGALTLGVAAAQRTGTPQELTVDGLHVLALPFRADDRDGEGVLCVARRSRPFREDEHALMRGLVDRAQIAVADVLAHALLREQVLSDPLTRLGNRRKLAEDLGVRLLGTDAPAPTVLMLFDLNGFKTYNDTFGHVAGDALLARLGQKLRAAVSPRGTAYRLGGDEFCVLAPADPSTLQQSVTGAVAALQEQGEEFSISASCGTVLLPHEASTPDYALQLADERMYGQKHGRRSGAGEQAQGVLMHIMEAKRPELVGHGTVAELAVRVGRRLGLDGQAIDELARAAALHDVGKVGVPDTILAKPGALDEHEWSFVRQHTLLGERILSAAPALRPVATIVRATHEHWDGSGYPDGLAGEAIPLAARIVATCDAYDAMTCERPHRKARSPELACEELRREAGRQFDPAVVEAFLAELERPHGRSHAESETVGPGEQPELAYAREVVARVTQLLGQPA